jgi:hypothetical protein
MPQAASRIWNSGDKALANLRLAFARLPRLDGPADAYRLWLAETLLDDSFSPRKLMKELGLDTASLDLLKYDENQPRVPAGNGRDSGRWGPGEGGTSAVANKPDPYRVTISEAKITPPQAAQPSAARSPILPPPPAAPAVGGAVATELFTAGETSTFVVGLSALVAAVGAVIVGGVILVPWQKNPQSEGPIPGDPNLHYALDDATGRLQLYRRTEDGGKEQIAIAQRGRNGIFFETETGLPIAREVKGGLAFDSDSLAEMTGDEGTEAQSEQKDDEPRLCPDPGPDAPHGASERAKAYQKQISALNNPQRPLPEGIAVSLTNPATGRPVVYDDCRESDGTMIEAKGPGYGRMLGSQYFRDKFTDRWRRQASRQIAASGGRPLEWYFADREAAEFARKLFGKNESLKRIKVNYVPADML